MIGSSGMSAGIPSVRGGLDGFFGWLLDREVGDRWGFPRAGDSSGQHFDDVGCLALGEMFDLLAAGDARDCDHGVLALLGDGREEALLADLARDVVVLSFVAE